MNLLLKLCRYIKEPDDYYCSYSFRWLSESTVVTLHGLLWKTNQYICQGIRDNSVEMVPIYQQNIFFLNTRMIQFNNVNKKVLMPVYLFFTHHETRTNKWVRD